MRISIVVLFLIGNVSIAFGSQPKPPPIQIREIQTVLRAMVNEDQKIRTELTDLMKENPNHPNCQNDAGLDFSSWLG